MRVKVSKVSLSGRLGSPLDHRYTQLEMPIGHSDLIKKVRVNATVRFRLGLRTGLSLGLGLRSELGLVRLRVG